MKRIKEQKKSLGEDQPHQYDNHYPKANTKAQDIESCKQSQVKSLRSIVLSVIACTMRTIS